MIKSIPHPNESDSNYSMTKKSLKKTKHTTYTNKVRPD